MDEDSNRTETHAPPLTDLILSLEQASIMAKHLPATTDPGHLLHIYSYLHQTNRQLSSFLSGTPVLSLPQQPTAANSYSSANGAVADGNGGEPMQVGDDDGDEVEENSKTSVDRVEERMRECFIKNKRPKRPLSPSSVAVIEEKRVSEDGFVWGVNGFDPQGAKLRALDLVYQFHG